MKGHEVHPVVWQSNIHYGRVYSESSQVIGISALVSILFKTPISEPRSGCYCDQIEYSVSREDHPIFDDGDCLMRLVFTVYAMVAPLDSAYNEAVKSLLGEGQEYYLLGPDYGESVIAERWYAGELSSSEAEALREENWRERQDHEIDGHVVVKIIKGIEGFTPAV